LERTGALQLAVDRAVEYATAAQTAIEGLPIHRMPGLVFYSAYIVERDR